MHWLHQQPIGLACALKLAEQGAKVFMAVRRVEDTKKICDSYKSQELNMIPVYFDATVEESYSSVVNEVMNQAGKVDILVNNFGIGRPNEDFNLTKSLWTRTAFGGTNPTQDSIHYKTGAYESCCLPILYHVS